MILDVRRRPAHELAREQIPEAEWRDPAMVGRWLLTLDPARAVVYCVHGHEISQSVALTLAHSGISARFLEGGIEAWKQAGLPVDPRLGCSN